jgi:hypothetical protein
MEKLTARLSAKVFAGFRMNLTGGTLRAEIGYAIGLGLVAAAVFFQFEYERTMPPDEVAKRVSNTAVKNSLCQAKAECSSYAAARQYCATAGNFDTCMSIEAHTSPP